MQEVLDVVDENNEVVGSAPFDDVYAKRLNHRIVHVLIFNDKGEIFLQQRSAKKSFCPGHWVTSAGGHVQKGETYEKAAVRELKEELGVKIPLTKIHESPYDHYKMRKFLQVFRGIYPGPFNLNFEEVADGKWFSVADVKDMVKKNQLIHPELAHVIEKLYP
ncbi:MAG TPA: NUDIX domain-containing protein [Candidatus Nanoarchaeia archaeon]|nr:NUDIX domain-containing protein [Candidatus Nanoarchaeia archaeon]